MEKEKKKYLLEVVIFNPSDPTETQCYNYDVIFSIDNNNYGNGTYLSIGDNKLYDLRYNQEYHKGHEIEFLTAWACNYWNGENGAYKLKDITIKTV